MPHAGRRYSGNWVPKAEKMWARYGNGSCKSTKGNSVEGRTAGAACVNFVNYGPGHAQGIDSVNNRCLSWASLRCGSRGRCGRGMSCRDERTGVSDMIIIT